MLVREDTQGDRDTQSDRDTARFLTKTSRPRPPWTLGLRGRRRDVPRDRAAPARGVASLVLLGLVVSCDKPFDPVRSIPRRGTLGEQVFGLVCDRVGAQSLREDVTGASFHAICHADSAGNWATTVDQRRLPPLTEGALDESGKTVPLAAQRADRDYSVARIEALGRRRGDLVRALDATVPDAPLPLVDTSRAGEGAACDAAATGKVGRLREELTTALSHMVALYSDGAFPRVTRALGRLLAALQDDAPAREALARLGVRQGYRPLEVAIGAIRPVLAYDRLPQLARALLQLISEDVDPNRATGPAVAGAARAAFEQVLRTLREELRVPSETAPAPLEAGTDAAGRPVLSRPRTNLELAEALLLTTHPSFGAGAPRLIVRRDGRGVARVATTSGRIPEPFVDAGGLPMLDPRGRFVTTDGAPPPPPFFTPDAPIDAQRDAEGRALDGAGAPLYEYVDVAHTYVGRLLQDLRPLLEPAAARDLLPKLAGGLTVLLGERAPAATRAYPAPGDGQEPIALRYRGFDAATSPLPDLVHALAQTATHPDIADALALLSTISREHPAMLARMLDLGLRLKAIADRHPEAVLPAKSMLWDDLLDVFAEMARVPGLFEATLRALADDHVRDFGPILAAFLSNRDTVSYTRQPSTMDDYDAFNGTLQNLTTGGLVTPDRPLRTPVDRALPDTGDNRSVFQRFLQLLHDSSGLPVCSKDGAVTKLDLEWPANSGIRIKLDYPTNALVRTVCSFVGATAPRTIPRCGILRFPDAAALILDVIVDKAEVEIRDDCLKKLMEGSLTRLFGGADALLEQISGIEGFNLHPSVGGVSRLAFFDAPYEAWGGYAGTPLYPKTREFLVKMMDPVPSNVCRKVPWTDPSDGMPLTLRECDRFEDTLRGRNPDALFPLTLSFGATDFVTAIRPLVHAFTQARASAQLVRLLDTLHLHWGSSRQSPGECDPSLPRTDARFCTGDGAVSYEPLLAEAVDQTGLFHTTADLLLELDTIRVQHCDERDARGACVRSSERDGVSVLAAAMRAAIDPERNVGLRDRRGRPGTTRNDGSAVSQVTPAHLLIDALKGMDAAFARHAQTHADGDARLSGWRSARSQLVDALVPIDRTGGVPRLANPGTAAILPVLVDVVRAQVTASCPGPDRACAWAGGDLAARTATLLAGPTTASLVDLLEDVRADPAAMTETQLFLAYLLDQASDADSLATTLTAAADLVQVLGDVDNLDPVLRLVSAAATLPQDPSSTERGLIDGVVSLLWRLFAGGHDGAGQPRCASPIDPHHALPAAIRNLVTPMGPDEPTPIEVMLSVIGDVNRADPRRTEALGPADFQNIGKETSSFLLDPTRGIEQLYTVLRAASGGS